MTDDVKTEAELRKRIEDRIQDFRNRAASLPLHSCADMRSVYSLCAALLKHDLSDGVCRCVKNNGVGRYVDNDTNLWCLHGKND